MPGKAACLAHHAAGCRTDPLLQPLGAPVFSPDGRHAYLVAGPVAGEGPVSVLIFARDRRSGLLRRIGCVGQGRGCTPSPAVRDANDTLTITSDGRQVLLLEESRVQAFDRDARTGLLRPAACLGVDGADCGTPDAELSLSQVAVSPDGGTIVLSQGFSDPFAAMLRRDAQGGLHSVPAERALDSLLARKLGTGLSPNVRAARFTPDGRFLLASISSRLAVFDARTLRAVDCAGLKRVGRCRNAGPIGDRFADSQDTLAPGDDGVIMLASPLAERTEAVKLDRRTGRILKLRCFTTTTRHSKVCAPSEPRLRDPEAVAPLPGGRGFIAASELVVAVIGHARGSVRLRPSAAGACVRAIARTDTVHEHAPAAAAVCPRMRGVGRVQHLSVSPDGRFAYVAGFESMTVLRVTR